MSIGGPVAKLEKPPSVESDPFRSAKWDELTRGRDFSEADAPALALLVQWYQVVDRCVDDMSVDGGVQVAFQNDMGDLKALPQIATMKQASAEIRQLNRQLGIADGRDVRRQRPGGGTRKASVLRLVMDDRRRKAGEV